MLQQKLLPEEKQCSTHSSKSSLPRQSSLQGIGSNGKTATASALLQPPSFILFSPASKGLERGPEHEPGLWFSAGLIQYPQTNILLMALEKLAHMALRDANVIVSTRIKMQFVCVYPVQRCLPLPFAALLPGRGLNAVLGTANYHFGFLQWCRLGLREVGATCPSAQQEMGHQPQGRWGCSMDLAWKRPQEGTLPLLPCLLRTLKKKKQQSASHQPPPDPHGLWQKPAHR